MLSFTPSLLLHHRSLSQFHSLTVKLKHPSRFVAFEYGDYLLKPLLVLGDYVDRGKANGSSIDEKISRMHGGLSPDCIILDQIRNLNAANRCHRGQMFKFGKDDRGVSFTFGPRHVTEFLQKHDLDLVGRMATSYCNRQLVTIFSAPNYCAIDGVDEHMCSFQNTIKPKFNFGSMTTAKPEIFAGVSALRAQQQLSLGTCYESGLRLIEYTETGLSVHA
ncbi:hypothetical protein DVH24_005501 [Malus domestica]|uniref:protein-serine/threonine phosphatase n=1 Tax=Malus domestica TaxID=3750 RepID=A0A498KP24_MALDO|nr:hypothetical protein DVH24_005501 [Malus domestica]